MFEVAPSAAFHAATPFYGGHIVVSRQVGALLGITAYGAQQQVGEKTADEDGDSSHILKERARQILELAGS